ncbi:hypothetical protein K8T06_16360 [bacterium]|nr:hypothetical protein [bacterium]
MKQSQALHFIRYVIFVILLTSSDVSALTHWVCQDCDPFMEPNYTTIQKAVDAADPNDIVVIVAEEFPPGTADIIEYSGHLVIDKPLTLKCKSIHPVLGYPIITVTSFDKVNEVVLITEKAAGSIISNLHIRGPLINNTDCKGNPRDRITEKVGIRIKAENITIDTCKVTHCMTGILGDQKNTTKGKKIVISNCTVGEPWIGVVDSYYGKEDVWTDTHRGQPIHHPGNGFGVVLLDSKRSDSKEKHDEILNNNNIKSNRYRDILVP